MWLWRPSRAAATQRSCQTRQGRPRLNHNKFAFQLMMSRISHDDAHALCSIIETVNGRSAMSTLVC